MYSGIGDAAVKVELDESPQEDIKPDKQFLASSSFNQQGPNADAPLNTFEYEVPIKSEIDEPMQIEIEDVPIIPIKYDENDPANDKTAPGSSIPQVLPSQSSIVLLKQVSNASIAMKKVYIGTVLDLEINEYFGLISENPFTIQPLNRDIAIKIEFLEWLKPLVLEAATLFSDVIPRISIISNPNVGPPSTSIAPSNELQSNYSVNVPAEKTNPGNVSTAPPAKETREALRLFLLGLLPDIQQMSNNQMRQFKQKALDAVVEILDKRPLQP